MTDFILKPAANGVGDFSNSVGIKGLDPTESAAAPSGTYDVFQKVYSGLRVDDESWNPLDLGPKLEFWLDLTSPLYVFSDVDRQTPCNDGDAVRGLLDRSGNGNHFENAVALNTEQSFDATNGQVDFKGQSATTETATNIFIDSVDDLTGATNDMEFYILIKTTDVNCGLINANTGANSYAGFMLQGGTGFGVSSLLGSSDSYTFDNGTPTAGSALTADSYSAAILAASPCSAGLRGLDMSTYTTRSLRFFTNQTNTRGLNGQVTHIVGANAALSTQERIDLQVWVDANKPV